LDIKGKVCDFVGISTLRSRPWLSGRPGPSVKYLWLNRNERRFFIIVVKFKLKNIKLVKDTLNKELEFMLEEVERFSVISESILLNAQNEINRAEAELTRLKSEAEIIMEKAKANQALLCSYEDKLGSTFEKIQISEVKLETAKKLVDTASEFLNMAQQTQINYSKEDHNFLEKAKETAILNAQKEKKYAQESIEKEAKTKAKIEEKIKHIKPKMDLCRANLKALSEIRKKIDLETQIMNKYVEDLRKLSEKLDRERTEQLDKMKNNIKAIIEPKQISEDAFKYAIAYLEAMDKIIY
jgi:chromosome segregation ATPase